VANNIEELKEMYMVRKSFEKGGDIDLLREFGDKGIFSYNKENGLKLNAILVIIDGPVPPNDTVTTRVFNDKYGVRLSDNKKYLYIYDGDENEIASDPISLTAKETSSGGSGGGCNAGYGLLGLLPLAVWVVRRRMSA
jgi:Synergist-CTERM protein sorting domain-containing protein